MAKAKQNNIDILVQRYCKKMLLPLGLLCCGLNTFAQEARTKQKLHSAAQYYNAKKYDKAYNTFAKALKSDSTSIHGIYGLACSLYKQSKDKEATHHYEQILTNEKLLNSEQISAVLHNMGNIAMRSKQYDIAISYYQKALIQKPSDNDTRYNLVLAQKLKEQQEQDSTQTDEQKNDKNEQQSPAPQSNEENKPNSPQQLSKDEQTSAQHHQQNGELTPQQAEQILNAFKQNDERTRKKVEQLLRDQEAERNNQTRRKW